MAGAFGLPRREAGRIVGVLCIVGLLAGCQGLRMPGALSLDAAVWPVSGGSVERQNAAETALRPPLALTWTYNAEAGFGSGSPLVAGGYVFVGTRRGDLHAIRLDDGRRLGYVSVGKSVEGAVALDGNALIGATAEGKRPLFRYDLRAGRTDWRTVSEPILSGVLLHGDLVIVADVNGRAAAYDRQDGTLRWEQPAERPATVRAAPVHTSSGVLIADDRGGLRLFDPATGAVRWQRAVAGAIYSTPAAQGETIFVATTRGHLLALDATSGAERWHYTLPDTTVRLSAPAVDGDVVVLAGTDGVVRLLDAATGAVRWTSPIDAAVLGAPLLTRETIFVGTMERQLIALNRADGARVWEYELKGRMKSAMAFADGGLIVLSEPRYVYRFDPVEADPAL